MAGESVARRYARAIFELALERQQPLESWLDDLDTIERLLGDPEIHSVLVSPRLSFETKRDLVDRAVAGLDELPRNLLYLLVQRNRVDRAPAIRREFRQLVLEHRGTVEATVTTAVPISDAEAQQIARRLERVVGKTVLLERRVDPAIIGGIVARVGDKLINGSVAGRLEALRQQLV